MEWILFLLICPLVMMVCMRYHNQHKVHIVSPGDMEKRIKILQEENYMLRDEVDFLSELVKLK